jgi:hypothetical protein
VILADEVEIARVGGLSITQHIGANNTIILIAGAAETIAGSSETITVSGVSYRAINDGARRIRCAVDFSVAAGDEIVFGAESMIAADIVMTIDTQSAVMEIEE